MATPKTKQGITLPNWVHYIAKHRGLIVPVGFVMLLVVILVPLPAAGAGGLSVLRLRCLICRRCPAPPLSRAVSA